MLASNPNADFWTEIDNEEYYADLLMAIEFSDRDRVSLFIAVCDVDLTQTKIINRYTEQLKPDFHAYQIAVNSNHLNVVRSIAELVDRSPDLQAGKRAVISVVGATGLAATKLDNTADKSDRDTFFGYLQWTRESFRNFHFPIILWVSKNIYDLMLSETPDFWSWRNGVFFFKSDLETFGEPKDIINRSDLHVRDLDLAVADFIPFSDLAQLVERMIARNPEDPLLISLYNRLASVYVDRLQTGKYADYLAEQNLAIDYFQKAIDLSTKSNPQDLATSINNLAELYHTQGRYAEAEPLYDAALAIRRTLFGERPNNDLAASLNNLAGLYRSQGKWAEAEPLYDEALAIRRTLFGDRPNNDLATSLNNLAGLYAAQGKWAKAEPLYVRALAIVEHTLGTNHPNTQTIRNNLQILRQQLEPPSPK